MGIDIYQSNPHLYRNVTSGAGLTWLRISGTAVSDVWWLQGMALKELYLDGTQVTDLVPLQGMPLRKLEIHDTDDSVRPHGPIRVEIDLRPNIKAPR